jgi:hypothetical protein
MSIGGETPQARPQFRKLASVMAVVCVSLAAVFGFVPGVENRRVVVGLCLFVGFVMLTIGTTGSWPPRRGR